MANFEPRNYQLEVLEVAKRKNIIAVLPTGSGKTFIAALLLLERLKEFIRGSSKSYFVAVFLAPTRVLVHQHVGFLRSFFADCPGFDVKVKAFTGETFNSNGLRIDRWLGSDWIKQTSRCDLIMVATPAIFADILQRSLLHASVFNCVVIDEVHHCRGNSSGAVICSLLNSQDTSHSIRILGLTASPLTSNKLAFESALKKLEEVTFCQIYVSSDADKSMSKFQQRAKSHVVSFIPTSSDVDPENCIYDDEQSCFPSYLKLPNDAVAVVNHAEERLHQSTMLCDIYKALHTLNKTPDDFDFLKCLKLHIFNREDSHDGAFYACDFLSSLNFNILKRLDGILRQAICVASEAGIAVALHALAASLRESSNKYSRSGAPDEAKSSVIDKDKLKNRANILFGSPFSTSQLHESESNACRSLIDVIFGFAFMLGPDIAATAARNLNFQPKGNEVLLSFLIDRLSESDISLPIGGNGILSSEFLEHYTMDDVSPVALSICKALIAATPMSKINEIRRNGVNHIHFAPITDKVLVTLRLFFYRSRLFTAQTETQDSSDVSETEIPSNITIIFCQMRQMALSLCSFFNTYTDTIRLLIDDDSEAPSDIRKLNSVSLIGGHWGHHERNLISRLKSEGRFNCLIATDVVEEGLDLPSCQLVINFDLPKSMTSFVQRKGRGRSINTHVVTLIPANDVGAKVKEDIALYGIQELQLNTILANLDERGDSEGYFPANISDEHSDKLIYVIPRTGAIIDTNNAIFLVYQFCAHLNVRRDGYYQPNPTFLVDIDDTDDDFYKCSLLLPYPTPPHLRCFVGPNCLSKDKAKAAVSFNCVRALHQAGEIDDWLFPGTLDVASRAPEGSDVHPDDPDEIQSGYRSNELKVGVFLNANVNVWIKTVPDVLAINCDQHQNSQNDCAPLRPEKRIKCHQTLFIYRFQCLVDRVDPFFQELYGMHLMESEMHLAGLNDISIALLEFLPNDLFDQEFQLLLRGRISIAVKILKESCNSLQVSDEDLRNMQRFHHAILAWESELNELHGGSNNFPKRSFPLNPSDWSASSLGLWYILIPPSPNSPTQNDYQASPELSLYFLKCANEAQTLAHNAHLKFQTKNVDRDRNLSEALYQEELVIGDIDDLRGFLISRPSERLGIIVDISKSTNEESGTSRIVLHLLPMHSELSMVSFLARRKNADGIQIQAPIPGSKKGSPLQFPVKCNAQGVVISGKFKILGRARWALLGLCFPCAVWRLQSYFLAVELKSHLDAIVTDYYLQQSTSIQIDDSPSFDCSIIPSVSVLLEAMTPRMAEESFENERMELLGDSLLKLAISFNVYDNYPKKSEGFLTVARSNVVSNMNLLQVCLQKDLFRFMRASSILTRHPILQFTPPGMQLDEFGNAIFKNSLRGQQIVGKLPSMNQPIVSVKSNAQTASLQMPNSIETIEISNEVPMVNTDTPDETAGATLTRVADAIIVDTPEVITETLNESYDHLALNIAEVITNAVIQVETMDIDHEEVFEKTLDDVSAGNEVAVLDNPDIELNASLLKSTKTTVPDGPARVSSKIHPKWPTKKQPKVAEEQQITSEMTTLETLSYDIFPRDMRTALLLAANVHDYDPAFKKVNVSSWDDLRRCRSRHARVTVKEKTLSDLIEALIGAVYLHAGVDAGVAFIKILGAWPVLPKAPVVEIVPEVSTIMTEIAMDISTELSATSENKQNEGVVIPVGFAKELIQLALGGGTSHHSQTAIVRPVDEIDTGIAKPAIGTFSAIASNESDRYFKLLELSGVLGYTFKKIELLNQATIHCSVQNHGNNQRLEFLGDAVLDFVVINQLFWDFPTAGPGDLTTRKCSIVNNENLGKVAILKLGLHKYLLASSQRLQADLVSINSIMESSMGMGFSEGEDEFYDSHIKSNTSLNMAAKALADSLEAIIGAVYLDSSYSLDVIQGIVTKVKMMIR